MDDLENEAEQARDEIHAARKHCEHVGYTQESRSELWTVFRRWIQHPEFDTRFNMLETVVLNELEFTLGGQLKEEGWALITELTAKWKREGNEIMMEALRIASFEIAAEPEEYPETLELLFRLSDDPDTRWAVFAAYNYFPWRLKEHALKYSGGSVSEADCDRWLESRNLGTPELLERFRRNEEEFGDGYLDHFPDEP